MYTYGIMPLMPVWFVERNKGGTQWEQNSSCDPPPPAPLPPLLRRNTAFMGCPMACEIASRMSVRFYGGERVASELSSDLMAVFTRKGGPKTSNGWLGGLATRLCDGLTHWAPWALPCANISKIWAPWPSTSAAVRIHGDVKIKTFKRSRLWIFCLRLLHSLGAMSAEFCNCLAAWAPR